MKKFYCYLVACCLSAFLISCTAQTNVVLNADEFEKAIAKDSVQLLDVRTPGEYFSGHIKGALQADWNDKTEFDRRIAFVDKNKPVYVYCLGGGRSAAAAAKLRKMGYENVLELKGGINAWKAASKPLEGAANQPQMSLDQFTAAISGGKTVLVDFGAEWCPPCKKMEPVIKTLQTANADKFTLVKVDGGRDQEIMNKYGVTALPVFIVFKNGVETWRKEGVVELKELEAQVK
ncbi:MAG: thioredoxin domain-containing protein [Ferruginibacter sp.]